MIIALIPARSGSKRVPGKNIRELAGHPLLAYTIQVAKDSGLFGEHIYVTSDSQEYLDIAKGYGAQALPLEPKCVNGDDSHWLNWALDEGHIKHDIDEYFILRPTSPFRTGDMLLSAWNRFNYYGMPLKAVSPARERPEKMWRLIRGEMIPYMQGGKHRLPSWKFDELYVQNSSLEIRQNGPYSLSEIYTPIITKDYEGFSIDYEDDWILAEALIERGLVTLPEIK